MGIATREGKCPGDGELTGQVCRGEHIRWKGASEGVIQWDLRAACAQAREMLINELGMRGKGRGAEQSGGMLGRHAIGVFSI